MDIYYSDGVTPFLLTEATLRARGETGLAPPPTRQEVVEARPDLWYDDVRGPNCDVEEPRGWFKKYYHIYGDWCAEHFYLFLFGLIFLLFI